ncbi:transposable element Tcb2 transposase [Trichonephila clavipes]|nr:transposable element Tcb2 transposase [Trichonephila clavipes]
MENRKETTIEERKLVIKLSNEGKSQLNIAKVVGRSVNCIQKILQKFKKTASTSNTLGRSVSAETVRRVLRKAGYDGRVARKKPLIEEWLLYHCRNQLNILPQSPDLNVIDPLWSHLERSVQKHQITSKEQLKTVLQEEWLNIAPETTRHLVESMPRRLEAVISAKSLDRLNVHPPLLQGGIFSGNTMPSLGLCALSDFTCICPFAPGVLNTFSPLGYMHMYADLGKRKIEKKNTIRPKQHGMKQRQSKEDDTFAATLLTFWDGGGHAEVSLDKVTSS